MQPEPASNLVPAAEEQSADVVPLPSSRAHAEELRTPPPHLERGDGGDGDGGTSLRHSEIPEPAEISLVDAEPPSDSEITAAVLSLRNAHTRSPAVVRSLALQLPRSVFVFHLEEVRASDDAGGVRNPVGLLKWRLEGELEARVQRETSEVAQQASARFGYGAGSQLDELRRDPERYIETMAPTLGATDVIEYLWEHVPDELRRARLATRAAQLRAKA
jgi:hypothetical protein